MAEVKKLEGLVSRLEATTQRLEALSAQKPGLAPKPAVSGGAGSSPQPPPSVKAYDEQIEGPLKLFLDNCKKMGGDVAKMADKVGLAFDQQRSIVWTAAGMAEPGADGPQRMLAPVVQLLADCGAQKEAAKGGKAFNQLAAMADGLQGLGWLGVKPTPAPFVKEMLDCSMFFVNRVRTEHKGDPLHGDWAKHWCALFAALQQYIRQWHTTGLAWNTAPGTQPPSGKATPTKGGSPAPPPPPPPPAGLLADLGGSAPSAASASSTDRQALFAALNKGEAITKGLKKVTADMQTHKNPGLRTQTTVPAAGGAGGAKSPVAGKGAPVDHPPKLELKDRKVWQIEYHKGNRDIKVDVDMKQSVYIFRCENSVVQIKGKVNSVTVDSSKKTSVVFDNLLSQVEVINCQSVEVQTLGALPTISIQKTDGCQVYLSKEALGAEIVTSKSSEMNVLVPKGDGDFSEFPVPEQFKTTFDPKSGKLVTVVSDIA